MKPMQPMRPMGEGAAWWPEHLGRPASSGGQNGTRYAFRVRARNLHKLVGHATVGAEVRLLHPHRPRLIQHLRPFHRISPMHNRVYPRFFQPLQLQREIIAPHLVRHLNRKLGFNLPLDGPKTLNGLLLELMK